MTDTMPLGFDLGNGALKLFGPQGGLHVLAQVSANRQQTVGRLIGLASQKPPLHIVDEAGSFYVGAGAHDWGRPIENLGHDRFETARPKPARYSRPAARSMLNNMARSACRCT